VVEATALFVENMGAGKWLDLQNVDATLEMGRCFAKTLQAGDVVAFFGGLGSGKTTLIKGVCAGLNSTHLVSSPTFTLIHEYSGRVPIYHFDFYRIASVTDALSLDLTQYFDGDGICLMEWSERILDLLPAHRIEVYLQNLFEEGQCGRRKIRFEIK